MAHYISYSLFDIPYYLDNRSNSRANTCANLTLERLYLLGTKPTSLGSSLVIHDIETDRMAFAGDKSYKFLPYQLWMVGYLPTMALTGNGRSGFDSGEGA